MFLRRMLPLLAAVCATFCVMVPAAHAAGSTKQIFADLSTASCSGGQVPVAAHFVLSGLQSQPSSDNSLGWVTVNTQQSTVASHLDSYFNGTARFSAQLDAPLKTGGTFSTVERTWHGDFYLGWLDCTDTAQPSVSFTSSPCGISPLTLSVHVTNNTNSTTQYTVRLGNTAQKAVTVLGRHTEAVDFTGVTSGSYSIHVAGDDGTSAHINVQLAPCNNPAPPTPTPSRSSAKPTPSPSLSQSAAASPMASSTLGDSPAAIPDSMVASTAAEGNSMNLSAYSILGWGIGGLLTVGGAGVLVYTIRRSRGA